MPDKFILASLTRIAGFEVADIQLKVLPRKNWRFGDFVCARITDPGDERIKVELRDGRMMSPMKGSMLIGALGSRYATLEMTGSWEKVRRNGRMDLLTGAGLMGLMTSRSHQLPLPVRLRYAGQVLHQGVIANMADYALTAAPSALSTPAILLVGTSMSAGKTTTAKIVIHQLKSAGLRVVGAKLTGAGRYRDILTMKDAGADEVIDFVDAGLPCTICPSDLYKRALERMLYRVEAAKADIAVIEVGASPLEPYNSDIAIRHLLGQVKCTILCASDPYAVYGVMKSFEISPDLVSGPASNTLAGRELVRKLTGLRALNIVEGSALPELRKFLRKKLSISSLKR